ncbi:CmpA/NrtA family ABC transporter substrate-binding protein [Pseudoduganella namucuonensis]|uniref:Nitrate/nitrite transport system substrate-binding protein n=1 Tax=Pseudoduganella namucuonensis TaxID=1035707 RepID=A0A1I7KIS3_9BURK|nr:CmpA/NrtA family ABC transporter substrate-binding protein [Pseudoduganella namucuonensis]SFU97302.1 nitrate/nitrite transport system substrate-binding protein [Pseudoduganella namucuonensis]
MANKAIPEKQVVRIGFNPLTDCASVVMAAVLGFDEKHGIKIVPSKETSWAVVRDKLLTGELDAAHALYGMVYGTQLGVGLHKRDMAILMGLNRNGQAITLTRRLAEQGATDGASLAALLKSEPRNYTFAHTFPTGTHAMWLCYWLAAHGIDPMRDARLITVPPSQMVQYMAEGHMDGFCAGEPWGHRAVMDGIGVTAATTQEIWPEHPEKVLAASAEFTRHHPNTCRAMIAAVLEAGRWIDASPANRMAMAEIISGAAYLDTSKEAIRQRAGGAHPLRFHHEGAANFPYLSDGMWFMTQQRRWGLLKSDPDYLGVARDVHQIALYKEAAEMTETPVPHSESRSSTLMDGKVWDGSDPERYAASFSIKQ